MINLCPSSLYSYGKGSYSMPEEQNRYEEEIENILESSADLPDPPRTLLNYTWHFWMRLRNGCSKVSPDV